MVPNYRKTLCDECAKLKSEAYEAMKNNNGSTVPLAVPLAVPDTAQEIKKETGDFQSTVWNHSVAANSYEVGPAGSRFKLYFETVDELKIKINELKLAGFITEEIKLNN